MNTTRKPIQRMSRQQKEEAYAFIAQNWRKGQHNLGSVLDHLGVSEDQFRVLDQQVILREERQLTNLLKQGKTQNEIMAEMNVDLELFERIFQYACFDKFIQTLSMPIFEEDLQYIQYQHWNMLKFSEKMRDSVRIVTNGEMVAAIFFNDLAKHSFPRSRK